MSKYGFADNLQDVAKQLESQARQLEERLAKGQTDQAQIEAELDAMKQAHGQLSTFEEANSGERICFECWMKQVRSPLVTMGGGTDTEDFFKCPTCKKEYASGFSDHGLGFWPVLP